MRDNMNKPISKRGYLAVLVGFVVAFAVALLQVVLYSPVASHASGQPAQALAGTQEHPKAAYAPEVPACVPPLHRAQSPSPTSDDDILHGISVRAKNDAWAVGVQGSYILQNLIEHWDGTKWSIVESPNMGDGSNQLNDVVAISANDAWAAGWYYGEVPNQEFAHTALLQRWNGQQWSVVSPPNPEGHDVLYGITAISANDIWAVGYNEYFNDTQPQMIHWNGTEWSLSPRPALSGTSEALLYSVSGSASNDVWAVGATALYGDDIRPVMLHWNGTEWSQQPLGALGLGSMKLTSVHAVAWNDAWAVGYAYEGSVSRTAILHWNGVAWSRVPSPNVGTSYNGLDAISGSSSNNVWAVGHHSGESSSDDDLGPLALHWDGVQWNVNPVDPDTHDGALLLGVSVSKSDPNYLWAVGTYFHSTYSQDTYTLYRDGSCDPPTPVPTPSATVAPPSPTPTCGPKFVPASIPSAGTQVNQLNAVAAVNTNDIWAVGYYHSEGRDKTLIEHWNGSTWSIVPSPNTGTGPNRLEAVTALSANDVWAVGYYVQSTGEGDLKRTLAMHWNGSNWQIIGTPNSASFDNQLKGVSGVAGNDVWAVGYEGPPGGSYTRTVTLHWNGSSWQRIASPNPLTFRRNLLAVTAIASNDVWAVGYIDDAGFGALSLHWDGSQWNYVETGVYDEYVLLSSVSGVASNDVWAVGYSGDYSTAHSPRVNITLHWDGQKWTKVPSPNHASHNMLQSVDALSSTEVWAVGTIYSPDPAGPREISGFAQRWDGSQWHLVPASNPNEPGRMLAGVAVGIPAATPVVWAVGSERDPSNTRRALAEYLINICPVVVPPRCSGERFTDVCPGDYFYTPVLNLNDRGVVSGYSASPPCESGQHVPCFRPYSNITRGQAAKLVALASAVTPSTSGQIFEDVAPGSPFYNEINALASRSFMGGYPCGSAGEPCGTGGRPYFRPGSSITRGQLSKIVSNTAGFSEAHSERSFEDVPLDSAFYIWIQRLASRGIISGYTCGAIAEPCVGPHNRSYFRPNAQITRGQTAKIVHGVWPAQGTVAPLEK